MYHQQPKLLFLLLDTALAYPLVHGWLDANNKCAPWSCHLNTLANWPIRACTAQHIEWLQTAGAANRSWVFFGLLLSTDYSCIRIAAAADLKPEIAETSLRKLLALSELLSDSIELSRWQRGGRQ